MCIGSCTSAIHSCSSLASFQSVLMLTMVLVPWMFAEILKMIIHAVKYREFRLKVLLAFGGMPSSHATFVSAITMTIFLTQGFGALFILSCALMILTVRDIVTLRGSIDAVAVAVEKLNAQLNKSKGSKNEKMSITKIAHTIPEMLAGVCIGSIGAYLVWLIFYL